MSWGACWAVVLLSPAAWPAQDKPNDANLALVAHAGTEVPITLGAGLLIRLPHGFHVGSDLGYVPSFYVDLMNDILIEAGAYNEQTAQLIHDSIGSSLSWSTRLGWQPWMSHGFYVATGYRMIALGGTTTGTQIVEAAIGREIAQSPGRFDSLDASMTLHMFDLRLGWDWKLGQGWLARAALGVSITLAANAHLQSTGSPRITPLQEEFLGLGETYLRNTATSYIHPPYALLSAGRQW